MAEMRVADVGPHADVWFGNADERADLALVVHAEFDDGDVRPVDELEQRQGQPDVVIEISAISKDAVTRGKELGRDFLGRRLAGAAGDRDDARSRPDVERTRARCLERPQRVGDENHGRRAEVRGRHLGQDDTRPRRSPPARSTNACPSKRSPRSAMNSAPGAIVRVSVDTAVERLVWRSGRNAAPGRLGDQAGGQHDSAHSGITRVMSRDAGPARRARPRRRRTAAFDRQ